MTEPSRLQSDEKGQAMAEFALVMPMLALLTFGTIEMAIFLQQQSSLNAAAFLASRSLAVTGGNVTKTKAAMQPFTAASAPYVGRAVDSMKTRQGEATVSLDASTDRFSGIISALTGNDARGVDTLGASAMMPLEYNPANHNKAVTGPRSRSLFTYEPVKADQILPGSVRTAAQSVTQVVGAIKGFIAEIERLRAQQPKPVTPPNGVTPRPATPKPAKPRPGSSAKPPGGGGTKPPAPRPTVAPTPPPPVIPTPPPSSKLLTGLPTAGEPFSLQAAITHNHTDYDKTNPNSVNSRTYLAPGFERRAKTAVPAGEPAAERIVEAMSAYETKLKQGQIDVLEAGTAFGQFLKVAERSAVLTTAAGKLKTAIRKPVSELTKTVGKDYKARLDAERKLFPK